MKILECIVASHDDTLRCLLQSQKTQAFRVADFATLSDERRSRSKIFLLFDMVFENLKGWHARNFLRFRKLTSQCSLVEPTDSEDFLSLLTGY